MSAIQRRLAESFPEDRNYFAVMAIPLQKDVSSNVREPLLLLFGSVTGVLLIACVNVAGLLVERGVVRANEFSVRTALGASAAQIVTQVLMESTILSCVAGIGGVALAFVPLKGFLVMVPEGLPRLHEVRIERVRQSMVYARFEAQLLAAFATAALLLAAVGLYATLSETVARRTFEIGIAWRWVRSRGTCSSLF